MAILLNKISEIEDVREMPNSEIEKYIQLAYKRENNRQILRERIIESRTYRDIIEKHCFFPAGDWSDEKAERVVRAWTNEIQRMETKFYRIVRRNRRQTMVESQRVALLEKVKKMPLDELKMFMKQAAEESGLTFEDFISTDWEKFFEETRSDNGDE